MTSIQVIPAGALEIRADRTNGSWLLAKPFAYPGAIRRHRNSAGGARKTHAGHAHQRRRTSRTPQGFDAEFGFDSPQTSLVIEAGDQRWQLLVGNKTAPGDQVFLRVVGVDGAFVADADWLKFIPHSASDWRSTALVARRKPMIAIPSC